MFDVYGRQGLRSTDQAVVQSRKYVTLEKVFPISVSNFDQLLESPFDWLSIDIYKFRQVCPNKSVIQVEIKIDQKLLFNFGAL